METNSVYINVIALYAKGRVEVPQTRPQLLLDV